MFGSGKRPIEKLDFIVAGAQKSATTALNYYLKRHPRVALPTKKELHFFDNDELFTGDTVSYEPLHKMFRPARPGSLAGENTPNYLYHSPALERIRDYNAQIKLIIILRNPIDRAFSQWNMQRSRGIEPLDFLDAIHAEPKRLSELPPPKSRKFAYVDRGRYAAQLARAFQFFPREQFLIIKYEYFRAEQREAVESIYRFLNLEVPTRFKLIEAHGIPYRRKISPEECRAAGNLLKEDISRLEQLLDWNCDDWV